ncbi:MAG: hypothetical protein WDN45_04655 [Caulobacteraceae bacterium]
MPFVESDKLTDVDGVIGQTVLRQADVEYEYNALGGTVKLAQGRGLRGGQHGLLGQGRPEPTPKRRWSPWTRTRPSPRPRSSSTG